ncbi:hypothetical protein QTO34_001634 [Cnephaeus nilssonii]|uniref:Nudix hydrolase domain-containing protein n=1 Tax=Cnephaeus nilssonii TaxID=3371016 RepID=A0AA40HX73_CNENI|nr:hypothetical protein QTO34_001634 [Eptesicus nilssonii]
MEPQLWPGLPGQLGLGRGPGSFSRTSTSSFRMVVVKKIETPMGSWCLSHWVLLVSSSRHPDRWIVPGGGMEPEEEPSMAAVREVCEEEQGEVEKPSGNWGRSRSSHPLTAPSDQDWHQALAVGASSSSGAGSGCKRGRHWQQNQERKHRTYVYVLIVTEVLEDWEDSVNIGRKREWFKVEEAIKVLQYHKPVQASYFETLRQGYSANNGTPVVATTYSVSSSQSFTGIR